MLKTWFSWGKKLRPDVDFVNKWSSSKSENVLLSKELQLVLFYDNIYIT